MGIWRSTLENLAMTVDRNYWRGKKVFVTGHTGFKGSWLSIWLQDMGAQVTGYALPPPTHPSLFQLASVEALITSVIGDVRDARHFQATLNEAQPEVIFHMAAQSLVRKSYQEPVETYEVNIMGTVHLLEAARHCSSVRVVVNITSDKCYENKERTSGYSENGPMGGHDPYSSSKGCSELVTAAYRNSYLKKCGIAVATARAGNVIGGGDWAEDRLIPDFFRALDAKETLLVRSPDAVRPWQHVLEPLSGYLLLAEHLSQDGAQYAEAWNFGPPDKGTQSVSWILDTLKEANKAFTWKCDSELKLHEALLLYLDSNKSRTKLGWSPSWSLEIALQKIIEWHEAYQANADVLGVTLQQIKAHQATGGPG
jgi:CDP-glucose 4,6-dehydratase